MPECTRFFGNGSINESSIRPISTWPVFISYPGKLSHCPCLSICLRSRRFPQVFLPQRKLDAIPSRIGHGLINSWHSTQVAFSPCFGSATNSNQIAIACRNINVGRDKSRSSHSFVGNATADKSSHMSLSDFARHLTDRPRYWAMISTPDPKFSGSAAKPTGSERHGNCDISCNISPALQLIVFECELFPHHLAFIGSCIQRVIAQRTVL